ncbi:MAG: GNAT family N-acetyltransferase [Proteobacteria bacterium]|nr:GNAT family N-acetyltransferase [Pseudomonadota bacterium]
MQATPVKEASLPLYSAHLPFKAERVNESALAGPLLAEWDALHARILPNMPFTSASWNALWWKHHRSDRPFKRDKLCLIVVRDARNALIAVAPMMSTRRFYFQTLRYFGADPNVTEVRGLVCEPENEVAAIEAVLRCLKREMPAAHWIEWGALRKENWERASRNLPTGSRSSTHQIEAYHLELPATWDALRSSRSRNIKESIRRCYNSLKREGLTPELRVISSPQDAPEALATFFRLHSMRSLATNTVVHANVFRNENDRAFLTEYALELAQRGELRIFQLLISGSVVATRVGFQCNDQIYLYYSGYDPAWSRYSVMTTLVVEAIKWSIDQRLATLHLSTGTDVSKLRWGPAATHYVTSTEVPLNWSARLSYATYQRVQRLISWWERRRLAPNTRREEAA